MARFSVRDLLLAACLVAVHFALARLESFLPGLIFISAASPCVALLIERRLGFEWSVAPLLTWSLIIGWCYLFGMTYSSLYSPDDRFFQPNSIGVEHPMIFGGFCAQLGGMVGVVITAVHLVVVAETSKRRLR